MASDNCTPHTGTSLHSDGESAFGNEVKTGQSIERETKNSDNKSKLVHISQNCIDHLYGSQLFGYPIEAKFYRLSIDALFLGSTRFATTESGKVSSICARLGTFIQKTKALLKGNR